MSGSLESAIEKVIQPLFEKIASLTQQVQSLQESLDTVSTDRLWSCDDVAQKLKVKRATVHTWTHRGLIQTVKQGRRSLVPDSELKRLLKNGGVPNQN